MQSRQLRLESLTMFFWTYGLGDVVNDDCAICVAVVHWCQGLVSLLSCRVPDFKLDRGCVIEGNGLCEECGADC